MPGKTSALQAIHILCLSLQSSYVAGKVTTPEESNLLAKELACRTIANPSLKEILLTAHDINKLKKLKNQMVKT